MAVDSDQNDAGAFLPNEVEDGGQTPGPFQMRRRVASSATATPASPVGIRKKKRKEKKRLWVWTIGQEDDNEQEVGGAIAALRAEAARFNAKPTEDESRTPKAPVPEIALQETPTPSVESADSWSDYRDPDVDMTDCSSVYSEDRESSLHPPDTDLEMKTPTEPKGLKKGLENERDTPIPDLSSRRDTPVPHPNRDTPIPSRDTPIPSELF
jgi:hypothetical protein